MLDLNKIRPYAVLVFNNGDRLTIIARMGSSGPDYRMALTQQGSVISVYQDGRVVFPDQPSYPPRVVDIRPAGGPPGTFDLIAHLRGQIEFSKRTFGPGRRTEGVTAHIAKELDEIRANPTDIGEWVDVILLALDGAWRTGAAPEEIAGAIAAKQRKNESRQWPDWREMPADGPIEHVKGG